ncbi:MAG: hypothetical protein PVH84_11400 [Candidatus Aminicenantes bacterium]
MKIKIILCLLFLLIFITFCDEENPTEPSVELFNLHIEGLVTLDGLPKDGVRIVLRDYGSGSVYSELTEVYTDDDGRYSLQYALRGDISRYRLVLYAVPAPGSGTNFVNVSITEDVQTINFEFSSH